MVITGSRTIGIVMGNPKQVGDSVEVTLLRYLKRRNMTAKEFCRIVGIKHGTLSRWCTRKAIPSLYYALLVTAATKGEVRLHDWLSDSQIDNIKAELKDRSHDAETTVGTSQRPEVETSVGAHL